MESIKDNLDEFKKLDDRTQKNMTGELLYPRVLAHSPDVTNAGKITGMLLDLEMDDLIEFMEDEDKLIEKVQEAEQVLKMAYHA